MDDRRSDAQSGFKRVQLVGTAAAAVAAASAGNDGGLLGKAATLLICGDEAAGEVGELSDGAIRAALDASQGVQRAVLLSVLGIEVNERGGQWGVRPTGRAAEFCSRWESDRSSTAVEYCSRARARARGRERAGASAGVRGRAGTRANRRVNGQAEGGRGEMPAQLCRASQCEPVRASAPEGQARSTSNGQASGHRGLRVF